MPFAFLLCALSVLCGDDFSGWFDKSAIRNPKYSERSKLRGNRNNAITQSIDVKVKTQDASPLAFHDGETGD